MKAGKPVKRKRSTIAGVLCGALCALCVGLYVAEVDGQAEAVRAEALERYGGEQIEVCVARRDIAPGETLTDGALETKLWVAALLPEGAVTDRSQALGKAVGTSILKGEVVLDKRFAAQTASLDVPAGLTAVSVPAREVQAIGGALTAGMRADVYAIGASSAERILAQAQVLATSATEADGSNGAGNITWVTLAVAPGQVQEVISAAENLELYFVLPAQAAASNEQSDAEATDNGASEGSAEQSGAIDPEKLRARVLQQELSAEGTAPSDASEGEGAQEEDASASADEGEGESPWIR